MNIKKKMEQKKINIQKMELKKPELFKIIRNKYNSYKSRYIKQHKYNTI